VAKKTLDQVEQSYFRRIVTEGGGDYVGIQEWEGKPYDLLLFNSKRTGSTLALKTTGCVTSEVVAARIHEHEREWFHGVLNG
jgi:hypothetical protein